MRPLILELDDALEGQPALRGAVADAGGLRLDARDLGPALRLWTRERTLEALRDRLRHVRASPSERLLVFAGSGDFHHVAPLLIARAAAASHEPVTVIHFDNHPDWMRFARGRHCGSWVGTAARLPQVAKVVTIGVCSDDIDGRRARQGDLALIDEDRLTVYAWRDPAGGEAVSLRGRAWPTIEALGEAEFVRRLAGEIDTPAVYVTVDKDVLCAADAATNWDQGRAPLSFVLEAVLAVADGRRVIGADVVGDWSRPVYGDGPVSWALKRGEAMLDQPWHGPDVARANTVNEAANLKLLKLFAGLR